MEQIYICNNFKNEIKTQEQLDIEELKKQVVQLNEKIRKLDDTFAILIRKDFK